MTRFQVENFQLEIFLKYCCSVFPFPRIGWHHGRSFIDFVFAFEIPNRWTKLRVLTVEIWGSFPHTVRLIELRRIRPWYRGNSGHPRLQMDQSWRSANASFTYSSDTIFSSAMIPISFLNLIIFFLGFIFVADQRSTVEPERYRTDTKPSSPRIPVTDKIVLHIWLTVKDLLLDSADGISSEIIISLSAVEADVDNLLCSVVYFLFVQWPLPSTSVLSLLDELEKVKCHDVKLD